MKRYKITQKVIRIGDSAGIIIPAKQLKQANVKVGDQILSHFEKVESQNDILEDYEEFKKQYGQTLKNLADR